MRALLCETYGSPGDLRLAEVPDPVAEQGQVVVRIEAAAVNFPDLLLIADRYQVSLPTPFTVGTEFAGTVSAVGPGVTGLRLGERVQGKVFGGAFAEYVVVGAAAVEPVLPGLTMVEAAAFGVTARTSYHALVTFGELRPGERVVVLGAAGGVGSACVDVATRLGADVVAVASSNERLAVAARLGATAGIVAGEPNVKDAIKSATRGGADVVVDPVGGGLSEQAIRAMRWGGRYVSVGFADGEIPRIPLNLVLLKGIAVRGFQLRTLRDHIPNAVAEANRAIADLVRSGLRPHIGGVYPFDRAIDALTAVERREVTGKVVIDFYPAAALHV